MALAMAAPDWIERLPTIIPSQLLLSDIIPPHSVVLKKLVCY